MNQTVSWAEEPRTRGGFSLLSSVITTLALCAWSAVHVNLLRHEESSVSRVRPQKAGLDPERHGNTSSDMRAT